MPKVDFWADQLAADAAWERMNEQYREWRLQDSMGPATYKRLKGLFWVPSRLGSRGNGTAARGKRD